MGIIVSTGIFAEIARLLNGGGDIAVMKGLAFAIYYVHLVGVFFLLAYFPYSKFAHIMYRTLSIIHARQTRRYDAIPQDIAAPAPAEEEKKEEAGTAA